MVDLNKEIKYVKGVGPNREVLLNKLKIYTLKDLITYYPRDYEDRSKPKNNKAFFRGSLPYQGTRTYQREADVYGKIRHQSLELQLA